ncbi:MAG: 50S ribosomal protein L29 [Bacteroidales bacterium]|nr:50S ribosomal protein L29 [Bacteroidales bacterium]
MKSAELQGLTMQELLERIDNEKVFLVKQKLNHAVSPLDNPLKIKETRKNIAKLLTELRRRQLQEAVNKQAN